MTNAQRAIKYFAIALAFSIIINIVYCGIFVVYQIGNVLNLVTNKTDDNIGEIFETNIENATSLDISLQFATLEIVSGEKFSVETNNKYVTVKQNGNNLVIKERDRTWFSTRKQNKLIVYVPYNTVFDNVDIETGAGTINIGVLNTNELSLEIGAGKVEIESLFTKNRTKIEGGAGSVAISSGEIANLSLDSGVGRVVLKGKLIGNNKINAGIGEINLTLIDRFENYRLEASKGIGSISLNDSEIIDGVPYGTGNNYIKIDGGIGSINISTER
jgi:hypothetical protein